MSNVNRPPAIASDSVPPEPPPQPQRPNTNRSNNGGRNSTARSPKQTPQEEKYNDDEVSYSVETYSSNAGVDSGLFNYNPPQGSARNIAPLYSPDLGANEDVVDLWDPRNLRLPIRGE